MPVPQATTPLILGIDHVLIHTQDVERMYALFREVFDLPVVWPVTNYGALISGGGRAGNMNIEIGRFVGFGLPGTRVYGLGFAPSQPTWQMVNGLVARDILHSPPVTMHYEEPIEAKATLTFMRDLLDGPPHTPFWLGRRWGGDTRLGRALSGFSTWMAGTDFGSKAFSQQLRDSMAFMCEYEIERHRERLGELTAEWQRTRHGGLFQITGVAGVDVEISDNWDHWERLLDRTDLRAHPVHVFQEGPPLRFHSGKKNQLVGFDFSCTDLALASQNLETKGWLATKYDERITIASDRVDGLTLGFCQSSCL